MEPHSDRLYFKSEESTDGRARGCVTPVFPSASGNCDQPGFVFVCGERVRHTAERLIRAAARTRARQGGPARCDVSASDKGGRAGVERVSTHATHARLARTGRPRPRSRQTVQRERRRLRGCHGRGLGGGDGCWGARGAVEVGQCADFDPPALGLVVDLALLELELEIRGCARQAGGSVDCDWGHWRGRN